MTITFQSQLNTNKKDTEKKVQLPNINSEPITTSEKLVRQEIKKLSESQEDIKKLREQFEKRYITPYKKSK